MFGKKFRKTLITFCLAVVLGLFLPGLTTRIIAQQLNLQVQGQSVINQPPASLALHQNNDRRRLPGRREPAAGRGCGLSKPQPPLTALSPETNLGFTVAAYPQFFFYIPQMQVKALKFSILKEDNKKIYEKTLAIPSTSGIFNLSIPANKSLPALEVGKDYHWYFQIICPGLDNGNSYVDGWVQRVEPNSTSRRPLERTATRENVSGDYAQRSAKGDRKNEFWYDAITTIAKKRRANPQNATISAEWENLLRSEGLENIAQMPLVGSLANGGS